jgi:hypothetical protein
MRIQNGLNDYENYLIHKLITYVKTYVQVLLEHMLSSDFRFYSGCQRQIAVAI